MPRSSQSSDADPTFPMTLLRHDTPDGEHHFDWLIARATDGPLIAFRLGSSEILALESPLEGVRMAEHRRRYLTFEGDIGHGRGVVSQVATGQARRICEVGDHLELDVRWDGDWIQAEAAPAPGRDAWLIRRRASSMP